MSKVTVTNLSQAPQGFYVGKPEDGDNSAETVKVGESRTFENVTTEQLKQLKEIASHGLIKLDGGSLDHDKDGKSGGSVSSTASVQIADTPQDRQVTEAEIDAMSDDDLHAFIETKTGRKAHSATSRDNLVIKAKGLLAPQQ